jgi:hypothetical protein
MRFRNYDNGEDWDLLALPQRYAASPNHNHARMVLQSVALFTESQPCRRPVKQFGCHFQNHSEMCIVTCNENCQNSDLSEYSYVLFFKKTNRYTTSVL